MATARVRLPDSLDGLMRSEMETAIREANLGNDDTDIARRYLTTKSRRSTLQRSSAGSGQPSLIDSNGFSAKLKAQLKNYISHNFT